MSEHRKETLSALFDGETSDFEARRLLEEMGEEENQSWGRYQLISDAMSNNLGQSQLSINVADAVAAAIADEDMLESGQSQQAATEEKVAKLAWLKPVAGFAVAASVAFVAVLGVQDLRVGSGVSDDGFVANGNVSAAQLALTGPSEKGLNAVSGLTSGQLAEEIENINAQKTAEQQRMDFYLQQHAQHASFNNGRGLMPMVRISREEY